MHAILLFLFIAILHLSVRADFKYETKTITVPLDHFSFAKNETFKLKYLYNDTYWGKNGPIFFYTGNEGDINTFAQNTGFMWEIAPKFEALVIFAEHRYYGDSLPFGNQSFSSPQNLGYLTSSQALADYVYLLEYLQTTLTPNNCFNTRKNKRFPVIAFGGSYGGMLAAWMRMKYPTYIQGAIAASAPVLQVLNVVPCGIFNHIVTQDFKVASKKIDCTVPIRNSWKVIRSLGSTDDGKKWLTDTFKLCKPVKTNDDLELLVDWLEDAYGDIAMVNYPYPTNFLAPLPAFPVSEVCQRFANETLTGKPLIEAVQKALTVFSNYTGQTPCIDTEAEALSGIGLQGWDFQACTEMMMPMCSTHNDMFETQAWNFTAFTDKCYKKWGVRMNSPDFATMEYGGPDFSAYSNIIFSNGLLDPWSGGGILHNVSKSILAILIPEGAHHLDLRSSDPQDPVSVLTAREFHKHHIENWISEYYHEGSDGKVVVV